MTDRLEHNADHRLDELVPQLYRLAVECEWQDFRVLALQRIVEWSGASAAAWLTRSEGQSGEYSVFPSDLILDSRAVAALTLDRESSLRVSPVPAALVARPAQGARQVVAHRHLHANSELSSVLVLYLGRVVEDFAVERTVDNFHRLAYNKRNFHFFFGFEELVHFT